MAGGVEVIPPGTSKAGPRPWGPWATIGWTLLCIGSMIAVQIGMLIVFTVVGAGPTTKNLPEITSSSLFLSTSTLTATPSSSGWWRC